MMSDVLDLIRENERLSNVVDKLIMSRIEITADSLDCMNDEQYEIFQPFLDKYYNEENVKKLLIKRIKKAKMEGKEKEEIAIADIIEPFVKKATDDFNKNDYARSCFWGSYFRQLKEACSTDEEFIERVCCLEKELK